MSILRALLASLCLTSLILAGCSKSSSSAQGNGQLRVVNAFSQANALDLSVNAKPVVNGLPFQANSQYASIDTGSQIFNVSSNTNYSYIVYGPQTAVGALLLSDGFNDPGDGFFSIRFVNTAAGPGALDLYLTPPGADISAAAPAVANIAYGSASLFLPIAKGTTFEIRITPAGTKDVIYDGAAQTFAEHSGASIVAFSKRSGKLVDVVLLRNDDPGSGSLIDSMLTQYKVVNASLVPSALNVLVDGVLQLANIPYTGVSNYQRTFPGAHTFNVEATTTPGASLLTLQTTLAAATDTSIVLNGPSGALHATVLQDNNLPPPPSTANVRFVNSSADVAAFDVFINFSKQVSGLAANSASAYINLNAASATGTSYEFDFNLAGTTTSLLKLTSVVLTAGHTYTVYLAGPGTSLKGIVSQDN